MASGGRILMNIHNISYWIEVNLATKKWILEKIVVVNIIYLLYDSTSVKRNI